MDNFIYSLNATVPVFLVIAVGYFLRKIGLFSEEFIKVADKFSFSVALPIMLLRDIGSMHILEVFDLKLFAFCVIATCLCFFAVWGLAEFFLKDKKMIGSFVQGSFRGSVAVLGIAFIQNMYGNAGLAPLIIVSAVPLYNIFSVIILTFKAESQEKKSGNLLGSAFWNIVKNPIIIGIAIGAIISLSGLQIPAILDKTLNNFAAMATPLALLTIGAGFDGKKALGKLKPAFIASLIKLVAQPAIFLPIAIAMGFRNQELIALLIMLGAPTTPSTYIMAKNMHNDAVLASSIIILTMLLAAVTLTVWIFVLKSLSFI